MCLIQRHCIHVEGDSAIRDDLQEKQDDSIETA